MSNLNYKEYDVKAIARAAIASVNAYADSILQEIRLKHIEFMQSLDWEEEARGGISHITNLILPHTSFEDWWASLSKADRSVWLDAYQEHQYGNDCDEKLYENYFGHCVMTFLSSRNKLTSL